MRYVEYEANELENLKRWIRDPRPENYRAILIKSKVNLKNIEMDQMVSLKAY